MSLSSFKEGKFPHCLEKKKKKKAKERWERLIWELRAIRRNGDKIALRHCWHAYCTQAWYICSQIRWMLPTREASFLVLVYLHTQSSVKIVLRLWSDRSYERFGKCFLAFGGGGDKTVKKCSFIKASLWSEGRGLHLPFSPSLFPSLSPSSPHLFSALFSPNFPLPVPPHHCLTAVEGSSTGYVDVWTWNWCRAFLTSSCLDRKLFEIVFVEDIKTGYFFLVRLLVACSKDCDIYPLCWELSIFLCLCSWCCRISSMCRVPHWSY